MAHHLKLNLHIDCRFSPERKTEIQQHAFLAFGSGNRSCIAKRLALLELRVAVVKLLMAFRFEKTAETPAHVSTKYKLMARIFAQSLKKLHA